MPRLREVYALTHHDAFCPGGDFLSYMAGQFLVTKHRVMRNPISFYKLVREMLVAPAEHWIHEDVQAIPDEGLRSNKVKTEFNGASCGFVTVLGCGSRALRLVR